MTTDKRKACLWTYIADSEHGPRFVTCKGIQVFVNDPETFAYCPLCGLQLEHQDVHLMVDRMVNDDPWTAYQHATATDMLVLDVPGWGANDAALPTVYIPPESDAASPERTVASLFLNARFLFNELAFRVGCPLTNMADDLRLSDLEVRTALMHILGGLPVFPVAQSRSYSNVREDD